jgi:hypothetical protein
LKNFFGLFFNFYYFLFKFFFNFELGKLGKLILFSCEQSVDERELLNVIFSAFYSEVAKKYLKK